MYIKKVNLLNIFTLKLYKLVVLLKFNAKIYATNIWYSYRTIMRKKENTHLSQSYFNIT